MGSRSGSAGTAGGRGRASASPSGHVLSTLRDLAGQTPLVSVRDLRGRSGLAKEAFDRAVLDLAARGEVGLHYHDAPGQYAPAERAVALVYERKTAAEAERHGLSRGAGIEPGIYYVGVTLRKP
jgi:hypothetical protein